MRNLLYTLAFILVTNPLIATGAQEPLHLDQTILVINDDVITETELEAKLNEARVQLRNQGIELPSEKLLRDQVLERFIIERLQLQMAQRRGIYASDQEIDDSINEIARKNSLDRVNVLKAAEQYGMEIAVYREKLREQIIIRKLVGREVHRQINISESEIDQFLETQRRLAAGQDRYNLSHIMIPIPDNAGAEEIAAAKARGEEVLGRLRKGESFRQLAAAYSQGREALSGGNLGWRQSGQLPDLFLEALNEMDKGQISPLLRSPNGFHILQLIDRQAAKTVKTVTQTRARHILIKPSAILSEKEALEKILEFRQRILSGESFGEIARIHSEDPLSAAQGGEMGWLSPGQTVQPFEEAMNSLPLNTVSAPVESQFGIHLIEVLERRKKDIGGELDRNNARNQLHKRKADERYQQWVRQLRDEAYIKILHEGG